MGASTEGRATTTPALRDAAAPVVAMINGAREALDGANTPEAVQDVRAKLSVMREACAAALRDPACAPEHVAEARRECEKLALEAAIKLGTMVPEPGPGARTDLGTSATAAEVAKRCGISERTLYGYRDLAAAFRQKADQFMSIAKEAIDSGSAVPFSRLVALVKPPKKDQPKKDDPPTPPPSRDGPRPNVPGALEGGKTGGAALSTLMGAITKARTGEPGEEEGDPEPEVWLPKSCEKDCREKAASADTLRRFIEVLTFDVETPSLLDLLKKARGVVPVLQALAGVLTEIADEDGEVVRSETERLQEIHRKAKASRKKVKAS